MWIILKFTGDLAMVKRYACDLDIILTLFFFFGGGGGAFVANFNCSCLDCESFLNFDKCF